MNNKLAIIIPAFKKRFFEETLKSLANQSCKKFTLYIGDDASEENLYSIICQYESKIQIVYHRFEQNLGRHDLVGHWDRCVDLTKGEDWLWLFSDDDVMDDNCVQLFYEALEKEKECELFHFNTEVIDEKGTTFLIPEPFPRQLSAEAFFFKRINFQIFSFVIEYVFNREVYNDFSKFENFDLGWSSDDATWIKFSSKTNIQTISGAKIKWRYSRINISSVVDNKDIVIRKFNANVDYLLWIRKFFKEYQLQDYTTDNSKIRWLLRVVIDTSSLSKAQKKVYVKNALMKLGILDKKGYAFAYLEYGEFKKRIKTSLRRIHANRPV